MTMNMSMDDDRLTQARDRLARLRQEAHEVAAETARIAERVAQTTYTAFSRGREVSVTVGPDALVRRVSFTDDQVTLSPRALAAATLDAHGRAIAMLRSSIEDAALSAPSSVRALAGTVLAEADRMLPSEQSRDDRR